jgi:aminomethyltransferase
MARTGLYDTHLRLGGRMIDFAGWQLPVQYPTGPVQEHHAVRTAAGLFDIDHMGQFELTGRDTEAFLQYVQVGNVTDMAVFEARYSLLTYADGTIVDDVFLYKLLDRWLIVVNAANRTKDYLWLLAHIRSFDATLTDVSDTTYMLALQGPMAQAILQRLTASDLDELANRRATETAVAGIRTLLGRTGYTGEDGFELYFPASSAVDMWEALLSEGAGDRLVPCGLGARDSLRFEACMPLYGHEISASTNPIEARLGWVVDKDHEFIGRAPILKAELEGTPRRLVGFEMMERAVPREGYSIFSGDDHIGHVSSGMKSPTLGKFLGMGYVQSEFSAIGSEIDILVHNRLRRARITRRPFYRRNVH